ncbi:hypothetical protein [Acinetobacter larvae]|uniref:Uncharacterized protein n=1 Tax=Acinetobacter larvae TaxID=1789224 RepID=A0A1B2LWL1_9GAMM|nr:hypothetical protein [Acinetobacter larvae]AOA57331.1 hypothetical protein BFG52_02470 [Acinetobacter larvae]
MAKLRKRGKKPFDAERYEYLLKLKQHQQRLQEMAAIEQATAATKIQIEQQHPLPLMGQPAYISGCLIKYSIAVVILYVLSIFPAVLVYDASFWHRISWFNPQAGLDYFWLIYAVAIVVIPIAILYWQFSGTQKAKQQVKNYVVAEDSLAIVYSNEQIKYIDYADISYVSLYSHKGGYDVTLYYADAGLEKKLQRLFSIDINFRKIFTLKNRHQLCSAFLQQLSIKNPRAHICTLLWHENYLDRKNFRFDAKKWSRERVFWGVFFLIIPIVIFVYLS